MTPKWQATIKELPPAPGAFTPAGKTVVEGLPAAAILDSVFKLAGIIRAVRDKRQSRLFAIVDGKPWFIVDETSLFAFLAAQSTDSVPFEWMIGKGLMTKREFLQYASQSVEQFDSVNELPHFPPVPGVFYTRPETYTGDGKALDQLVKFFVALSHVDYRLIRAMIVTLFWGGPPGSRPVFLLRASDDDEKKGCGVGKTTLAELAARLVGLVAISSGSSTAELPTRLLSPDARVTAL